MVRSPWEVTFRNFFFLSNKTKKMRYLDQGHAARSGGAGTSSPFILAGPSLKQALIAG